ncbi:50S ribosomal protein L19 [Patescibacteria group bacterium]
MTEEVKKKEEPKPKPSSAKVPDTAKKDKKKTVSLEKKPLPSLKSGLRVKVSQKVVEGDKERLQAFEGHIIAIKGKTEADRTITVRRLQQGYGVERIFPLANPNVVEVEVLKSAKVRRSKLYYLRQPKAKQLKDKAVK